MAGPSFKTLGLVLTQREAVKMEEISNLLIYDRTGERVVLPTSALSPGFRFSNFSVQLPSAIQITQVGSASHSALSF
jgi:hypothetical protein